MHTAGWLQISRDPHLQSDVKDVDDRVGVVLKDVDDGLFPTKPDDGDAVSVG